MFLTNFLFDTFEIIHGCKEQKFVDQELRFSTPAGVQ